MLFQTHGTKKRALSVIERTTTTRSELFKKAKVVLVTEKETVGLCEHHVVTHTALLTGQRSSLGQTVTASDEMKHLTTDSTTTCGTTLGSKTAKLTTIFKHV